MKPAYSWVQVVYQAVQKGAEVFTRGMVMVAFFAVELTCWLSWNALVNFASVGICMWTFL